jgi:hypothetical protein
MKFSFKGYPFKTFVSYISNAVLNERRDFKIITFYNNPVLRTTKALVNNIEAQQQWLE